jgi:nitrate reductase delta subunit
MERTHLTTAYSLISELFLYPEDRDTTLVEAGMVRLGAVAELREPLEAFLAAPAATSAMEYVATLELAPPVPLYLGSYLYEEPQSCRGAAMSGRNGYMLELANIYRHFGVETTGGEMADFVPIIVEFLGISLERGDRDRIGLRRYLVETLLINGIESLLSALRKYESPYAHLAEALRVALTEDIARMADGPKWQPPAHVRPTGEDHPSVPAAIRGLTATERVTPENGIEL